MDFCQSHVSLCSFNFSFPLKSMILIHFTSSCTMLTAMLRFTAATLPCSMKESVKISSSHSFIYKFNTITIKIPEAFLKILNNLTLKYTWKCKGPMINKTRKKNKVERKSSTPWNTKLRIIKLLEEKWILLQTWLKISQKCTTKERKEHKLNFVKINSAAKRHH